MFTRRVILAIAAVTLLAGAALADPTIKITFPEKSAYLVWVEAKSADGKPVVMAPERFSGQGEVDFAPVAPAGKLGKGELRVYDPKSGNLAVKSLENLAGKKELKLKEADFDRVGRVRVVLKPANGKPEERIGSAVVTLTDANSDVYTTVVDPTSEGVAEFRNIAAGMESVQVAYEGRKMTTEMEVASDREDAVPTEEIALSGKDLRTVKVAAAPAAPAEEGAPAKSKSKKGDSRNGTLSAIAGVIFLVMVLYIGWVVLKSKGVTPESALRKMGAELPQDAAPDASGSAEASPAPQVDPSTCQFCGQKKDASGNCACSVTSGAAAATSTGVPRLVGLQGPYSGHIFEVTGAELTLGRDASNTVALVDDGTSSRRHAKIDQSGGGFTITDLGSSNGTFVNGAKINGSQPLTPGDEVQVGSTRFKFEV